jgi:hypothetical protein
MLKKLRNILNEGNRWKKEHGYIEPRWKQRIEPIRSEELDDHIKKHLHSAVGKSEDNLRMMSLSAQARLMRNLPSDVISKYNMDVHPRPLDDGEMPYFKHLHRHIMTAIKNKNEAETKKDPIEYRKHKVALAAGLKEMEHHFGGAITRLATRTTDPMAVDELNRLTTTGKDTKAQQMKKWMDRVRGSFK